MAGIDLLHEIYIQQLAEFPTNFLHNPNMTKADRFGETNTDIIPLGYPSDDRMKTRAFAFTDNSFH
jgi:hypothetical protein